jgi:hypothetical protein
MWIFIWKATEYRNARAEAHSDTDSAWRSFKDMRVGDFPNVIMRMDSGPSPVVAREVTINEFMTMREEAA